jgi:Zn-finger in ubiquitin-hydrolases and other protein
MKKVAGINPDSKPSGTGCVECLATDGWWLHLRRCAECGHIGCCDSSPSQHASRHARDTGHPIVASFEPGEHWYWNYRTSQEVRGAGLVPPHAHPASQPVPGPAGMVPQDWESQLN